MKSDVMMLQESVDTKRRLLQRVLIAAFVVIAQDLSNGGGAQAWTYNYSITSNRRWLEARQWCQQHFTDMVSIQSQEESDFLNSLLPYNAKYYWIGLNRSNGTWIRVPTNEEVPEVAQNWAPEEPDEIPAQDCVEIYIKRDQDTAKWNNENCRKKKGTICYTESCTQASCSTNADCVEAIGNYTCRCHPGFMGSRCEEAIACKPLLDPEQGFSNCFHPFGPSQFNSSCSFHCELGFQLVGVHKLVCQASGQWNHPVPLCQAEQCPVLNGTSISAGSMNCSHPIAPYSYNSTCKARCDEGYESSGPDQIRCDHTGQWTASISACTVVQCNSLKAPPNASMQCQDPIGEYSFSSMCTVMCEEGFDLIGTNMTKCSSEGNWSHPLPVCQVKRCDPIRHPPHGSLSCSDPNGHFSFGSQCTLSCDMGFLLNGTAGVECNSLGMWSADIPRCLARRCPTLNSPSHGSFVCSGPYGNFSFGSRCTSACEEGFVLKDTAYAECTSLGTWSRELPGCHAHQCPLLVKTPQHGRMNCSHPHSPFSFGSQCHFGCKEGFWLRGSPSMACSSSGHWTQDLPTCRPVQCKAIRALSSRLTMNCSHPLGNFSFGSQCLFTCREGFSLNGTGALFCSSTGFWNASLPECTVEGMPVGAAMLMYSGVGAVSVVVPLVLIGLGLLIITRFKKREHPIMSDSATWEEQENPAFEF